MSSPSFSSSLSPSLSPSSPPLYIHICAVYFILYQLVSRPLPPSLPPHPGFLQIRHTHKEQYERNAGSIFRKALKKELCPTNTLKAGHYTNWPSRVIFNFVCLFINFRSNQLLYQDMQCTCYLFFCTLLQ